MEQLLLVALTVSSQRFALSSACYFHILRERRPRLECDNGGVKEVNALIKVINFLDSRSKSSQILVSFKLNLSVFYL